MTFCSAGWTSKAQSERLHLFRSLSCCAFVNHLSFTSIHSLTLVRYSIIGSLLESGTAALFDYLDVEWHGRLAPSLHKYQQLDSVYESRLRAAGVEVDSGNFYDEVKCLTKGGELKCFQKK